MFILVTALLFIFSIICFNVDINHKDYTDIREMAGIILLFGIVLAAFTFLFYTSLNSFPLKEKNYDDLMRRIETVSETNFILEKDYEILMRDSIEFNRELELNNKRNESFIFNLFFPLSANEKAYHYSRIDYNVIPKYTSR